MELLLILMNCQLIFSHWIMMSFQWNLIIFSRYLTGFYRKKAIAYYEFHWISSKELYVDCETSPLHQIAHGLMSLQSLYGIFPNVVGKGRYTRNLFELMTRMRRDIGVDYDPPLSPLFDTLMIIDRTVDLITPVVTQLTYEGLIDEFYGIKHSKNILNNNFLLAFICFFKIWIQIQPSCRGKSFKHRHLGPSHLALMIVLLNMLF